MHVFPAGRGFIATYSLQTPVAGLISNNGEPVHYPTDYMTNRINDELLGRKLASLRLDSNFTLFGNFIAGPRELIDFAGKGSLNTDDRPLVIYKAPEFAYTPNTPAHERLFALLDTFLPTPNQILAIGRKDSDQITRDRLKAYWTARDKFLHAGVDVDPALSLTKMLDQIKDPLLSIVRESPDFEAAYDPLLAMAHRLYQTNPDAAERLLVELEGANPFRREAGQLRKHYSN
jgi:spermidine synthase